jgi:uncharacterized membrane protein YjjP (DUF1212 family)/uncharacterized membrane protein YjjB (DUF3815 family)
MALEERTTLLRFLSKLGQAELAAGNAVALVERDLGTIAERNGVRGLTASVLPTVLHLQLDEGEHHRTQMALGPYRTGDLRFDQIEAVLEVAREARNGTVDPAAGLRRLEVVWRMRHQYRDAGFVLGYFTTALGVALMLRPTSLGLAMSAAMGLFTAFMLVLVRRLPAWRAVMPVAVAFLLASAVAQAHRFGMRETVMDLLIPPLIVFLPGSTLTIAMVELAFANMVSGASRLVAGFAQLLLLAFGLVGGFKAVGGMPVVAQPQEADRLPVWGPWLGVVLFALGLHLYKSSRLRSLPAMFFTMVMAYLGQSLSGLFVDGSSTAFFGAVIMTLTALTIEYRLNGPPALVTFLPAFWLLAPGAFGLASVAGITVHAGGAAANILQFFFTLAAIAMGCLIGAFLYGGLFHIRRSRWWSGEAPMRTTAEAEDHEFPSAP